MTTQLSPRAPRHYPTDSLCIQIAAEHRNGARYFDLMAKYGLTGFQLESRLSRAKRVNAYGKEARAAAAIGQSMKEQGK